eukprot:scaffold11618_cov84-Skeletonema_dohrnii-CCMP3373.AAC.3
MSSDDEGHSHASHAPAPIADDHSHASGVSTADEHTRASNASVRSTFFADDEQPLHANREESTQQINYPFLGRASVDVGRPITAPEKVPDSICELFQGMRVGDTVKRRHDDDDQGQSEEAITESLVMESIERVGSYFDSELGQESAATLHAMDPDSNDLNPPSTKRHRVSLKVEKGPSSAHMKHLIPCSVAPSHDSDEFAEVFKTTLCDEWGVWEYLVNTDPLVNHLYLSKMGTYNGSDLQLRYAIISTSILSDQERREVFSAPKEIGQYSVIDILSLWFASDECTASCCGGGEGARTLRSAWLSRHPYPIGRNESHRGDGRGTKLEKFYKYPNVILAMYLFEVITAFDDNRLRAHQTALGLQLDGFHWVILNESGGAKEYVSIPCVDDNIIGMIRLTGFANAVVCSYYDKISDDNGEYIIDGVTFPLGIDFMDSMRCHGTHIICFDREHLTERYNANSCIALRGHVTCSDVTVNLRNHVQCNGKTVTIINEFPNFARTLHTDCSCGNAPGNFSGQSCNFASFRHLYSDASSFEKINPNPNGGGLLYNYVPSPVSRPNDSEDLRNHDETRTRVRQLMGLPANDGETFNDEPEFRLFTVMDGFTAVLIDFETTALEVSISHILELALLNLHEEKIHSDFINPGVHNPAFQITRGAFNVHGISKMKLAGKIGTKDGLKRMFGYLDKWRKKGTKLCLFGHNIRRFDLQVLRAEARRHNLDRRLKGICYVDTLEVLKSRNSDHLWADNGMERPASFTLENLYNHIFGRDIPNQHSAVGDVLANAEILWRLDPNLTVSRGYIRELN